MSYFKGSDPSQWHTGIARYGRVRYRQVYPGIDLLYYGHGQTLEFDFVVAPGADPRAIRMEFAGQDRAHIDAHGDLVLEAGGCEIRQHRPLVYQNRDGRRQPLNGRYVLDGQTVNLVIPDSVPTGSAVPLSITIGGVTAQGNFTIGVQ